MTKILVDEAVVGQALEALELVWKDHQAITALRQALEKSEAVQEALAERPAPAPAPVPEAHKPLTDEQIWDAYMNAPVDIDCHVADFHKVARAIEAAHGITKKVEA